MKVGLFSENCRNFVSNILGRQNKVLPFSGANYLVSAPVGAKVGDNFFAKSFILRQDNLKLPNKNGFGGEAVMSIYRVLFVIFIAVIVLGLSSVYYDYSLDVRDAEARIIGRQAVECVSPEGFYSLEKFDKENLMIQCGYESFEVDRFYAEIRVVDSSGKELERMKQGDSGVLWVKELFENSERVERIEKYRPGYFDSEYSVVLKDSKGKEIGEGKILVEVLVRSDG